MLDNLPGGTRGDPLDVTNLHQRLRAAADRAGVLPLVEMDQLLADVLEASQRGACVAPLLPILDALRPANTSEPLVEVYWVPGQQQCEVVRLEELGLVRLLVPMATASDVINCLAALRLTPAERAALQSCWHQHAVSAGQAGVGIVHRHAWSLHREVELAAMEAVMDRGMASWLALGRASRAHAEAVDVDPELPGQAPGVTDWLAWLSPQLPQELAAV